MVYREENFDITQQQRLVIGFADLVVRQYPEGTKLTARSDHIAAKWNLDLVDSAGRLARQQLRLMDYTFALLYRAGMKHQNFKSLWRLPTNLTEYSDINDDITVMAVGTRAQKQLIKVSDTNLGETLIAKLNHVFEHSTGLSAN